jgi:hypothetical protein
MASASEGEREKEDLPLTRNNQNDTRHTEPEPVHRDTPAITHL